MKTYGFKTSMRRAISPLVGSAFACILLGASQTALAQFCGSGSETITESTVFDKFDGDINLCNCTINLVNADMSMENGAKFLASGEECLLTIQGNFKSSLTMSDSIVEGFRTFRVKVSGGGVFGVTINESNITGVSRTLLTNVDATVTDTVFDGRFDNFADRPGARVKINGTSIGEVPAPDSCDEDPPTDPGCTEGVRFIDKGLTVLDCQTNLEWEKKHVHNVNDTFTWSQGSPWNFDGTAADYIDALNMVGFAGRNDWRLPMVAQGLSSTEELETILLDTCPGIPNPCIDPIFGYTADGGYWSQVTHSDDPGLLTPRHAWYIDFHGRSTVFHVGMGAARHVRAVRGP